MLCVRASAACNLTLSATGQVQAPPHAADAAGWLSAELSSFPADRVTHDPNPMFLGAPVYGGPDGPLDGCRISPDRWAPVARGSLIRRAGILPDDEFLDAALVSHRRVDRFPRVSTSHFVQTVAAFGAGLLPPSRGQFLLGAWPPLSASRLPFAITVKVVGVRSPRTGFVRGSLVSGRVLFQRRAPVLLSFCLTDLVPFAAGCAKHEGPLHFVPEGGPKLLSFPFPLGDLPRDTGDPYLTSQHVL